MTTQPPSPSPPRLAEVSEQAALGSVASTYADIRRVLGVPTVVLIYRALAAEPGRLERAWGAIAANLAAAGTQRAAASLDPPAVGDVEPLPRATLAAARVDPALLAATLDGFDRANRLNLIGLSALLAGVSGDPDADPAPAPPQAPREMLPMADLGSLPPGTLDLLQRMSTPVAGPERPTLIPSLFRYFAHDQELLGALWHGIGPAVESDRFQGAVAAVKESARDLAEGLPYPVARSDDRGTREIVTRFTTTIPGMIVTTKLLRLAFRELLGDAMGTRA